MRTLILAILLAFLALALNTAYSEPETATVFNRHGLPMTVNGERLEKLPASISPGSTACVVHRLHYLAPDRRLVFEGWSTGETTACLVVKAGNYEALYEEQVLVIIDSDYQPLRRSLWVRKGEPLVLEVEREYIEGGYRFVFERWSRGEYPFSEVNTLVATEPLYVEARFRREVRVDVLSAHGAPVNGSGWYRLGELVVISAPEEIVVSGNEKLVFSGWLSVGYYPAIIYGAESPVATLEARAPHVVRADYVRFLRVYADGPQGVIVEGWFREGELLQLSTPPTIELIPDASRLLFIGWEGDISSTTPSIKTTVNAPISVRAVYRLEYKVNVKSPAGAMGAGWYPANSTALIWAPTELQAFLFAKRVLSRYAGDCGESCLIRGPLSIKVDSPKYVEAIYGIEPDLPSIGGAGAVGGTVFLIYVASKRRSWLARMKNVTNNSRRQED